MASSIKTADFLIESRLRDAARGDTRALFDLGIAYSSGTGGIAVDLVAAHKWFNLAALQGDTHAQSLRAEVADDMTARDIAMAQRDARAWLGVTQRRAA